MKIKTALKSRTVWCGIIATAITILKLVWPESEVLDDVVKNKETLASQFVLLAQGVLGVGTIFFRINAKERE
jgi:hypothetical protein